MNKEESLMQLKKLIYDWEMDRVNLNQTDINAIDFLLKNNEDLQSQLSQKNKKAQEIIDLINNILKNPSAYYGVDTVDNILSMLNEILEEGKSDEQK